MAFDYTQAPPPRGAEPIPHGTVATVLMRILPGNAGEGGLLKRSAKGDCEMLMLEFTVIDGEFKRRKFWTNLILEGTTDGHAKAAAISRGILRGIIESVRGIKPSDLSPEARAARTVELNAFDGLSFDARIGVEKGRPKNDGSGDNHPDKNFLVGAVTPDRKEWRKIEQQTPPPANGSGTAEPAPTPTPPTAGVPKPRWAS
jgi:hypothetical protein